MILRRTITREAVLFVSFLTFGLIIFPAILILIAKQLGSISPNSKLIDELIGFYKACGRGYWIAWAVALVPYLFYQSIRSCMWAAHRKKVPQMPK